jgi:hypothetical protein
VLSACLSALAGVYTEKLMKMNDDTLYWQNLQLYSFGVIFNAARLLVDDVNAGFSNGFTLLPHTLLVGLHSLPGGCQIGYMGHTGCHQMVL